MLSPFLTSFGIFTAVSYLCYLKKRGGVSQGYPGVNCPLEWTKDSNPQAKQSCFSLFSQCVFPSFLPRRTVEFTTQSSISSNIHDPLVIFSPPPLYPPRSLLPRCDSSPFPLDTTLLLLRTVHQLIRHVGSSVADLTKWSCPSLCRAGCDPSPTRPPSTGPASRCWWTCLSGACCRLGATPQFSVSR